MEIRGVSDRNIGRFSGMHVAWQAKGQMSADCQMSVQVMTRGGDSQGRVRTPQVDSNSFLFAHHHLPVQSHRCHQALVPIAEVRR